ncbi:hypothetical protein PIB30_075046 [Stylosanthes scabra]|uniref:Pentatricopeptide repeat-containing protein n=1 Tax=Stylosanthes scabra TaxID=79078 RepID=A0ABU6UP86_9FABA|nr:hypothetical protein [Stylosanthes scabra]
MWNKTLSEYLNAGQTWKAIDCFADMIKSQVAYDSMTILVMLSVIVRLVHTYAIKAGIIFDSFISTSLIDVYSKGGNKDEAEFLFHDQDGFDLASWIAMVHGYMVSNSYHKALGLFIKMHKSGEKEDPFTLANAAKAVKCLVELEKGKQIHAVAIKRSFNLDLFVISCILDMYVKCGEMESECRVFSEICFPDYVAWTTMISGCVENGYEERALFAYWQTRLAGVQPDKYTFATLVKASSLLTSLEQGRQIHADIIKLNYALDPYVITSLVDMIQGDRDMGQRVAEKLFTLDPSDSAVYVLLSNIHKAANQWEDATSARNMMKRVNVKKDPGFSWIDVNDKVVMFVAGDRSYE